MLVARCVVIVIDSGGIGALPDAGAFGDAPGADTIGNVSRAVGGLSLPNFARLGLGELTKILGVDPSRRPAGFAARLTERSTGKDTITGHWEMAGILTDVPFPTFPGGFPPEVILHFTQICGVAPLGNTSESGTAILMRLGAEHVATGRPIVYTSADSVFQVAAHEDVVPVDRLYDWCARAREMLVPPCEVNRVIARPFVGEPGAFVRTANRRDFAVDAPPNALDAMSAEGIAVHGVGKIGDIFGDRGLASSSRVRDDAHAIERTLALLDEIASGFIFTNLTDFDTKFGHRRDVRGYAEALERLDRAIPALEAALRPGDVAIFTADHGCDPTAPGSDHTREYVPFIEVGARRGYDRGERSLAYVGERVRDVVRGGAVLA